MKPVHVLGPADWWRGRTLHARLALLVAGAVAAAVVAFAVAAWLAVAELQRHQISTQLNADAVAIAAQPDQWLRSRAMPPGTNPPGTNPPGTNPPGTNPPGTNWPGTNPPGTNWPGTNPRGTNPRGTNPRGTDWRGRELGPRWQIIDSGGTVLTGPENLPVTASAGQVAAGQRRRGTEERIAIGGDSYQMLTLPLGGGGAVQVAVNQDESRQALALLALLLATGCVLGIGGAALAGRAVARAGLVPVERLTKAVEQVAATTDLTRPIEVSGDDEIARLGRSVNTMLAAIDSARRAQRALVEDAGHELRTPLTSIRTNVELLLTVERHPELADRLPPEERAKLLGDLDAQVRELATLTAELVELAREEAARESVEELELADVVTAAINRVRIRAPGLTFTADLTPAILPGRPGELERMVVNALDNAAKWSPPGGTVRTVLAADGPGWCRLTVADTGPGIAGDDLPHVFDRFYRAAAARSMPGSGLGLAIVAQIAAQHGGTVAAGPNAPRGTVLAIRLPLAPAPA